MDIPISVHRAQKMGDSLYILLPNWWTKANAVEHGQELSLGKNQNGELCIEKRTPDSTGA
jgi:antitoxin component of MazEF toxin-antitoxin module